MGPKDGSPIITYDAAYFRSFKTLEEIKKQRDFKLLFELLEPGPRQNILDLGCGLGHWAYLMRENGARVIAIDASEYAIAQAKCEYERQDLDFICKDALEIDYQDCFDKAFCFHVLEHLSLQDARLLLRKISRSLKVGGLLVLGIPLNDFHPLRRAIRFLATGRIYKDLTHQISFSGDGIKRELSEVGLTMTDILPFSYFGPRLSKKILLLPILREAIVACVDIRAVKKCHSAIKPAGGTG